MTAERDITVSIPAIRSEIFFARMEGEDAISSPFAYNLLISTTDMDVEPLTVLGSAAVITVTGDTPRHFHGFVADFALDAIRDDLTFYRMTLRPWLWFLSLDNDNRIFQKKNVPDIVEEVFSAWPDAKFKLNLQGRYDKREYCVQYGESDLNFVQRLLEDEGIFYYFEHAESGHTMVIVDANKALEPGPDSAKIPYEPDSHSLVSFRDGDFITEWVPKAQVRSGKYAQTDYDFKKPAFDLMSLTSAPIGHKQDKAEVYHYPGRYLDLGAGDRITERRMHELQADQHRRRLIPLSMIRLCRHRLPQHRSRCYREQTKCQEVVKPGLEIGMHYQHFPGLSGSLPRHEGDQQTHNKYIRHRPLAQDTI